LAARWHRLGLLAALLLCSLPAVACAPAPAAVAPTATPAALALTLVADDQTRALSTTARTVGEALAEAGVALAPADEVDPPAATVLSAVEGATVTITVVRVTETTEVIPEAIPFGRRIVRSTELSPDDPPRLLQTGQAGLREVTVRIVYRNGLEVERWPTATTVVEAARDEIIMIGVAAERDRMTFAGLLALIDDGRAVVLDGASDAPRQLAVTGTLDGRVFQLSPDGSQLLYTIGQSDTDTFRNTLWVIATTPDAAPRALDIENVLWAGWDPSSLTPRIAYTTARSTTLPPGWEANNDLWLLDLPPDGVTAAPVRLIESYAAAYAWWGGQYAWSPDGRLAYAFADEVGVLTMPTAEEAALLDPTTAAPPPRAVLHTFTEYDTGADWAWLPALSWSADGRFLAFTAYAGEDETTGARFDLRLADVAAGNQTVLVENAGIWSFIHGSPTGAQFAGLRATDPAAGQASGYALWLADSDGSDARRLFPPEGESGAFARLQPLAWGPDADRLAFIFDDALHILELSSGELYRADRDDTVSSHPTWAPYGPAAGG
jgi:Tol biopolymer transport system component